MRATHQAGHCCAHIADHLAHDTPLSAFFAEVAGDVGTSPPRTAISPPRTAISLPANGGICSIRGATRRRHAGRMLLMVQKPPLCLGGGGLGARGRRGACGLGVTPFMPGHDGGNCTIRGVTRRRHADRMLLMLQNPHHYSGVMLPRWYRTARLGSVGCRKGAADGTLLHVRVGQAPINAGKASPTGTGQGKERPALRRRLLPMRRDV